MRRREFLVRTATAAGVAWLSSKSILQALTEQTLSKKFAATDTVTLGSTGIKTSRLAMEYGEAEIRVISFRARPPAGSSGASAPNSSTRAAARAVEIICGTWLIQAQSRS